MFGRIKIKALERELAEAKQVIEAQKLTIKDLRNKNQTRSLKDIDISTDADAIMLVHNLSKRTKYDELTNTTTTEYNDSLVCGKYMYQGQRKSRQFDQLLYNIYTQEITKPVFIVTRVEDRIINVYKTYKCVEFQPREPGKPPHLVFKVTELDMLSPFDFKLSKKVGITSVVTFMNKLKITKLLNRPSGIHPVKILNEEFLAML